MIFYSLTKTRQDIFRQVSLDIALKTRNYPSIPFWIFKTAQRQELTPMEKPETGPERSEIRSDFMWQPRKDSNLDKQNQNLCSGY